MQRDQSRRPFDRLFQPAQPEQQEQRADAQLHPGERQQGKRPAEQRQQDKKRRETRRRPFQGGSPATGGADGEDDGQRLDEFDKGGEKGGGESGEMRQH